MKRTLLYTILLTLGASTAIAQDLCDRNLKLAKEYLEEHKVVAEPVRLEIAESVEGCATNEGLSIYVQGLLALRENPAPDYPRAFSLFSQSAELGITHAKTYLGFFYKNGWGLPVDLDRSRFWIEQAAAEGEHNATYALGYYYLKGLGGLEVDYHKAVAYFQQSEHPMAQHWLAFCKFYGFGTGTNEREAAQLLTKNTLSDSDQLLEFLDGRIDGSLVDFEEARITSNNARFFELNQGENLNGLWLEKDWKNEKVLRQFPVVLNSISKDENNIELTLTIEDKVYVIKTDLYGNLLSEDLTFTVKAPFASPLSEEYLEYHLDGATVSQNKENGDFIIDLTIWLEEYQEKGPPVTLRFSEKESIANKLNDSFSLYPTVFQDVINISVEIEQSSMLTLTLYDLNGSPLLTKDYGMVGAGNHQLEFDGSQVKDQNCVAVLKINDLQFARRVIKTN